MAAAGSKGAPKNPREIKDDNNASREEKLVNFVYAIVLLCLIIAFSLKNLQNPCIFFKYLAGKLLIHFL